MTELATLIAFAILMALSALGLYGSVYYGLYPLYISKFKYEREARFILKRALKVHAKPTNVICANINLKEVRPNYAIFRNPDTKAYNIGCNGSGTPADKLKEYMYRYFPDIELKHWTVDNRSNIHRLYLTTGCDNFKTRLAELEGAALKLIARALYVEEQMNKSMRSEKRKETYTEAQRYISERYKLEELSEDDRLSSRENV